MKDRCVAVKLKFIVDICTGVVPQACTVWASLAQGRLLRKHSRRACSSIQLVSHRLVVVVRWWIQRVQLPRHRNTLILQIPPLQTLPTHRTRAFPSNLFSLVVVHLLLLLQEAHLYGSRANARVPQTAQLEHTKASKILLRFSVLSFSRWAS